MQWKAQGLCLILAPSRRATHLSVFLSVKWVNDDVSVPDLKDLQ